MKLSSNILLCIGESDFKRRLFCCYLAQPWLLWLQITTLI